VVSLPTAERIIVDGGMKTFGQGRRYPYGLFVEHPEIVFTGMSVEHGHVDVTCCDHRFGVGEKLTVIPRHAGMTTNLHDEVAAVRDGEVVKVWRIQGRGKVR